MLVGGITTDEGPIQLLLAVDVLGRSPRYCLPSHVFSKITPYDPLDSDAEQTEY